MLTEPVLECIIIYIFIYHFVSRLSDKQITETLGSNTTNKEKQDLDLDRKMLAQLKVLLQPNFANSFCGGYLKKMH
jgi:hypothetical protein